ncbi:hypothetical protein Dimus_031398 [Dionaea muscipula]
MMTSLYSPCSLRSFLLRSMAIFILSSSLQFSSAHRIQAGGGGGGGLGRRGLLSFREKHGDRNSTFDCSPSGPCVPCEYSEKNDGKYRCSETGYRIPLKCLKIIDPMKASNGKNPPKSRSILEGSSNGTNVLDARLFVSLGKGRALIENGSKDVPNEYISYRSCIPAVDDEKLSVLGLEVFMLGLLLLSGSVVFFRRKKTLPLPGVGGVRLQNNSRY